MSADKHPLAGSKFLDAPLEKHEFEGSGNDFLCTRCQRPRALHADRGPNFTTSPYHGEAWDKRNHKPTPE